MLRVEHPVWRLSILAGLLTGAIWAQESLPKPAANAGIVRVRIGNSCGWCTEGYNEIETTVEPGRIVIANRSDSDKKKYPDLTQEYQITRPDWRDLQRLIDTKVLAPTNRSRGPSWNSTTEPRNLWPTSTERTPARS
jgi:hypothetical protein